MDLINAKIKFYTEIVKLLITSIIVLTGGLTAILFNIDSYFKFSIFIGGVILELVVIMLLRDLNKEIFCLFKELEEK